MRAASATASAAASTPEVGRAFDHLIGLQKERGDWEGEMVWNTMILSQWVVVQRIVGREIPARDREQILKNYRITQNTDGSWGMHPESPGFVFFTALGYVALRILGVSPEDPLTARARDWLRDQPGGVLGIPTWGKLWLAFVDLYGWDGVNPVPPELYALPSWLPIHPSRYYCHTRNIYMGLAYLYGRRFRVSLGPLGDELRRELYATPYDAIDFSAYRHEVAGSDLYVRPSQGVRATAEALRLHERVAPGLVRDRALEHCFERIVYEQRSSRYQAISPVNGLLNCLALFARDPAHPDLAPSLDGMQAWRWDDEAEGIRYTGARSNSWDTAFAIQALLERGAVDPDGVRGSLARAYRWLVASQMTEELPRWREEHRDPALGGWCFSDGVHRWPVSDCTAEAVCAITRLHDSPLAPPESERIPARRLAQAAEFILYRQNDDGGFGTYERRRGGAFLEGINNTEMYGNCMTERSYIECTSSSIAALAHLKGAPGLDGLRPRLERAIARGVRFLRDAQRSDGSWPGFWGVNFTYAIFHVVKGLAATGVPASDPALGRAAGWLVAHQRSDGAWGETWRSCLDDRYAPHPEGQPVMTAWALLALLEVVGPDADPVARGLAWLRASQLESGGWPQGGVNGVFFGSAMLDYRLYKSYFPSWALGRHAALTR